MEKEPEVGKSYPLAELQEFMSRDYFQHIFLASKSEIKMTAMPTGFVLEAKYKIIDRQPFYLYSFGKLEYPQELYTIYYIEPV